MGSSYCTNKNNIRLQVLIHQTDDFEEQDIEFWFRPFHLQSQKGRGALLTDHKNSVTSPTFTYPCLHIQLLHESWEQFTVTHTVQLNSTQPRPTESLQGRAPYEKTGTLLELQQRRQRNLNPRNWPLVSIVVLHKQPTIQKEELYTPRVILKDCKT